MPKLIFTITEKFTDTLDGTVTGFLIESSVEFAKDETSETIANSLLIGGRFLLASLLKAGLAQVSGPVIHRSADPNSTFEKEFQVALEKHREQAKSIWPTEIN